MVMSGGRFGRPFVAKSRPYQTGQGCHQVVFSPGPQIPAGTSKVCVRQRLFDLIVFEPAPLKAISQKCGIVGWPVIGSYGASVDVFMSDELLLTRFISAPLRREMPSPLLPITVLLVTSFFTAFPISDMPPSIVSPADSACGPGGSFWQLVDGLPELVHEFWPLSTTRLFRILFLDEMPDAHAAASLPVAFAHATMPWLSNVVTGVTRQVVMPATVVHT
jgi:hypothetical protein